MIKVILLIILTIVFTEICYFKLMRKTFDSPYSLDGNGKYGFGSFIIEKLLSSLLGFVAATFTTGLSIIAWENQKETLIAIPIILGVVFFFYINWKISKKLEENENSIAEVKGGNNNKR